MSVASPFRFGASTVIMMKRALIITVTLLATACSSPTDIGGNSSSPTGDVAVPSTLARRGSGEAPAAPTGNTPEATAEFERIVEGMRGADFPPDRVQKFVAAADVRHAWLLSDLLRFTRDRALTDALVAGFEQLTGTDLSGDAQLDRSPWNLVTNHLISWDTPAPPDYQRLKGSLFALIEPKWAPFFDDQRSTIDYRWLSWGGVYTDDRPLDDPEPCRFPGCIPALDDPALVAASDDDWYDEDAYVFGVREGDEAVALPKNIMEIHEMVNITIGGRRFGIPYCTLCGSAQAFYTDDLPDGVEQPVLRTSGLLSRSNKVMYDLVSGSAFDTFTGDAVTGPLRAAGVTLTQATVTVTTWGEWKAAYPLTRIIAEDGGIGRQYPDDPLEGRDDNGPIFPIGDADDRLDVQAPVVGVVTADGTTIAFSVADLDRATGTTGIAQLDGVTIDRDGGGYRATIDGEPIASHEAFWFAWSQFHPDTSLWPNDA